MRGRQISNFSICWVSEQAWQFNGFSSTQTSLSGCDVQRKREDFANLFYLRKFDIEPTLIYEV